MTKQELQERLNKLATEIRAMADKFNAQEKRWADAAEKTAWDKLNTDYNEVRSKLDEMIEAEAVEARAASLSQQLAESPPRAAGLPGRENFDGRQERERDSEERSGLPSDEQQALALQGFFRAQMGYGIEERHYNAMRACRMHPGQPAITFRGAPTPVIRQLQRQVRCCRSKSPSDLIYDNPSEFERRAMSTYQMSGGGALVGSSLVRALEINMLAFGGMRQVADILVTPSGDEMSWPTADDTGNEGSQIGENESVGTNTQPTTGRIVWRAYKFTSLPVLVDYALLEDAPYDLPAVIGGMLGERLGRVTNRKYTNGGGNGTATGLITAASQGTTASSTVSYDDIIKLEHSVDPAYRGNGQYMMHDTILQAVRLLKDSYGQYLWMNGVDVGSPDMLNKRPLTINQHMDSTTTSGKKPLVFGDLSKYKIRRVGEMRLYRLQERYRDTDQDGFVALIREDGNLLNAGTNAVKYLAMT